jgi:hypothetical protein
MLNHWYKQIVAVSILILIGINLSYFTFELGKFTYWASNLFFISLILNYLYHYKKRCE